MNTYSEPKRFNEQSEALDNFADLAKRQVVTAKGINAEELEFDFPLTVNIKTIDDLVCAIEQDYYLNKIVMKKLHYLTKETDQLNSTFLYVNRYLSASYSNTNQSELVKKQSLSRLNLL